MLCFGTCTIPLTQTLRRDVSEDADARLMRWAKFSEAAVFDEAFANDDRGHQNILTDGKRFWLIDNEHAFGNQYHHPGNLISNPAPLFSNTLLNLGGQQPANMRLKLKDMINPACGVVLNSISETPFDTLIDDTVFRAAVIHFLEYRSSTLVGDCMKRLGLGSID